MLELLGDRQRLSAALLERLKAHAELRGESERQLARRLGSSDALFKNLRSGSVPTVDRLDAILKELGISLTLGHAEPNPVAEPVRADETFVSIPLHDATLAAGHGAENASEAIIDSLAFRRDWLSRLGVKPSSARLARIMGRSMERTIFDQDLALIDTSDRTPRVTARPDGSRPLPIYALRHDGGTVVKRIHRPAEGPLMLLSDNPDFPPQTISGDVSIIGRVRWWGHTVRD